MDQISLFAGDFAAPTVADLGGLLAAHGQIAHGPTGASLSILLTDPHADWRAGKLAHECELRGLTATVADDREASGVLVRTGRTEALGELARRWTQGSVKAVPPIPQPPGGFLRCWALAAGRVNEEGYLLGLDERASQSYPKLAAALSSVGVTGAVIGSRGGGPGIRVTGRRRLGRLAEYVGDLGSESPPAVRPN